MNHQLAHNKCCTGCHACTNICPQQCISMVFDTEGFLYPVVNDDRCTECGLCTITCPILFRNAQNNVPKAYAAYSKDNRIRRASSSGGLFTVIAHRILDDNGVVFGAAFDDQFNVVHEAIENRTDLPRLQGSKYVQSRVGDAYRKVEIYLKQDRKVLFSGTPCQIGGMKAYLKKDYDNLICQDLICHGVPSPKAWECYLNNRIQRNGKGSSPTHVTFRHKDKSWRKYNIRIDFENGNKYKKTVGNDPYMQMFLLNISLRPSCHCCSFKTLSRISDITLADYWGIQNQHPEMDDDFGTSLLLIHSDKGHNIFNMVKNDIIYKEVDAAVALKGNPCALGSSIMNQKRGPFFSELNGDFDRIAMKYSRADIDARSFKGMVRLLMGKLIIKK